MVANGGAYVELDEIAGTGEGAIERPERASEYGLRLWKQVASRGRDARSRQGQEAAEDGDGDGAEALLRIGGWHVALLEGGRSFCCNGSAPPGYRRRHVERVELP